MWQTVVCKRSYKRVCVCCCWEGQASAARLCWSRVFVQGRHTDIPAMSLRGLLGARNFVFRSQFTITKGMDHHQVGYCWCRVVAQSGHTMNTEIRLYIWIPNKHRLGLDLVQFCICNNTVYNSFRFMHGRTIMFCTRNVCQTGLTAGFYPSWLSW